MSGDYDFHASVSVLDMSEDGFKRWSMWQYRTD